MIFSFRCGKRCQTENPIHNPTKRSDTCRYQKSPKYSIPYLVHIFALYKAYSLGSLRPYKPCDWPTEILLRKNQILFKWIELNVFSSHWMEWCQFVDLYTFHIFKFLVCSMWRMLGHLHMCHQNTRELRFEANAISDERAKEFSTIIT